MEFVALDNSQLPVAAVAAVAVIAMISGSQRFDWHHEHHRAAVLC